MPIKVSLCEVSVIARSVELPDKCPHCGADLHKGSSLISGEYNITEQDFNPETEEWGEYRDGLSDTQFVVYWKCSECRKILVEGMEHYRNDEDTGASAVPEEGQTSNR